MITLHNRLAKFAIGLVYLVLASVATAADESGRDIVVGKQFEIHSAVLGEDRPISVYLPPSYVSQSGYTRYPVLYVLDGEAFFTSFSSTVRYLSSATTKFPEMIVVAIRNTDRNRDFTPTPSRTGAFGQTVAEYATTGGLANFLEFMKTELMPKIELTYRTAPYRLIVGHSLSGLAVVQTMITAPELFDAYVAIDPSLWWDDAVTVKAARQSAKSLHLSKKQLFLASAPVVPIKTLPTLDMKIDDFMKAISANRSSGWSVTRKHYPDEEHGSVPLIAFMDGITKIFAGHNIDRVALYDHPENIDKQYSVLSQRLGAQFVPRESMINNQGYWFLENKDSRDVPKALKFLEMNVRNYPESANAWDSLAEATLANGDKVLAVTYYKRSLALDPKNENATKMLTTLGAAPN